VDELKIRYEVRTWEDDDWVIAQAWPLDVVTQGRTHEEAAANLRDAVTGFLKAAREHGTLLEVLEECGYKRAGDAWDFPPVSSKQAVLYVS
jgi:predicted RNase H-like HicB family nuclease